MQTEYTHDDHLRDQQLQADLISAFGCAAEEQEKERCPMCGDPCLVKDFDTYRGQRMCPDCVELERYNDAEKVQRPDYAGLIQAVQPAI